MNQPIDTSPARLREMAAELSGCYAEHIVRALEAIAAEKEAQAKQEPVTWAIGYGGKPLYLWTGGDGALLDLEVKRQGGDCQKMALYLAPQPSEPAQNHAEQHLGMVEPVRLTDEECREIDLFLPIKCIRAIESAVLKANGIGGDS